jgi:hypothetical protein
MKNRKKINLPVIAEQTKKDFALTKSKDDKSKFIESIFYQTSKVICDNFHKPLYLKITK